MTLFSRLKQDAKRVLRGNWGGAIAALIVFGGAWLLLYVLQAFAIELFVTPVTVEPGSLQRYGFSEFFFEQYASTSAVELIILAGFTVIQLLVLAPLSLGLTRWFWLLVRGEKPPLTELFHFFESGTLYLR